MRDPIFIGAQVDHEEGAAMAIEVVTAIDGAEYRPGIWDVYVICEIRVGQFPLAAAYGIPHDDAQGFVVRAESM